MTRCLLSTPSSGPTPKCDGRTAIARSSQGRACTRRSSGLFRTGSRTRMESVLMATAKKGKTTEQGDGSPAEKAASPCRAPRKKLIWHVIGWGKEFEPDWSYDRHQASPLRYVKLHIRKETSDAQQTELQRRMLLGREGG